MRQTSEIQLFYSGSAQSCLSLLSKMFLLCSINTDILNGGYQTYSRLDSTTKSPMDLWLC